jgi:hypothetical protein
MVDEEMTINRSCRARGSVDDDRPGQFVTYDLEQVLTHNDLWVGVKDAGVYAAGHAPQGSSLCGSTQYGRIRVAAEDYVGPSLLLHSDPQCTDP